MHYLFTPPPTMTLPIQGSDTQVPVRRIYCVGQNYAEHAKEMGSSVSQDTPFFFIKHPLDMVMSGASIDYPAGTDNLHYELELVAVIGRPLKNTDIESARRAVCGFAVGLDLTRRDLQQVLRSRSHPWALSKSFAGAAVLSSINTNVDFDSLYQQSIVLKRNGIIRQNASLGDMARSVEELIVYLSTLDTLHPGDLVFTGTPSGVGAVQRGDRLHGSISGIGEVHLSIVG
ncbi:MAG: fumarylacetoacetase [Gammaproteobacteria bacterium]|nr:MAG: fumarylacetoacetase [Gammaproteobacteria bacterium]